MKLSIFKRLMDYITDKKHIFIVKSSDGDNTQEILETVQSTSYADVDVYSDCEKLFLNLNRHKGYYQVGVVNKNDKKNTANILANMVSTINPRIKIVTYTDKNSLKKQLAMS